MILDWMSESVALALVGALGGVALGLAARLGRFCTLGAIEDALYGGSWARMRMWGVALGGAIFLTFLAGGLGLVTLERSVYLSTEFALLPVVLGGLVFGYGMAIAGNCGFGALARLGGGDLRSFVIVLVMGLSALAVLSGPFAQLRLDWLAAGPASESQGIAHGLSAVTGLSAHGIGAGLGLVILGMAAWDSAFLRDRAALIWSVVIALAISGAWVGTTWIATHGFAPTPVTSHTFAAPLGATMLWLMTASGTSVTFGVGSVAGVLLGAFIGSLIKGHFRWEACEDPRELRRQITGAALMGGGAVIALGCSVGQGLSAFSVLAYSAPLALGAIILGAMLGLRQLITGLDFGLFSRS